MVVIEFLRRVTGEMECSTSFGSCLCSVRASMRFWTVRVPLRTSGEERVAQFCAKHSSQICMEMLSTTVTDGIFNIAFYSISTLLDGRAPGGGSRAFLGPRTGKCLCACLALRSSARALASELRRVHPGVCLSVPPSAAPGSFHEWRRTTGRNLCGR